MTPSEKRLLAVLGRFESFWDLKHRVESLWFNNLMIMRKVSDEFRGTQSTMKCERDAKCAASPGPRMRRAALTLRSTNQDPGRKARTGTSSSSSCKKRKLKQFRMILKDSSRQ